MKNMNRLNQREIENLSAYLDHELTESEEAQLRARLAQDVALREALEDLRLTRYTLRNAPRVKRQRSFTLTPEMVGQQRLAWRALNFSRIMAVTASVLFAAILGGQLLLGGQAGMLASAPPEEAAMNAADVEESMMMEAPAAEPVEEAEMQDLAAESTMDEGAMDMQAAEAEMVEEASPEEPSGIGGGPTPTPEGTPAPPMEGDAPQTQEPGGGGGEPPDAAAEPAAEPTIVAESRTIPMEKDIPDDAVERESMDAGGEAMVQEQPVEEPYPEPAGQEGISWIVWVQIVLGVFALAAAGAWIYFRRIVR